ncbi:hypothetical protein BDR04DRAFT_142636 [Suillus decipiens]|nr:hypothetical protein BDR04DRAFT_142636 [Suillus decipiens]
MGIFDHIPERARSENFPSWQREVELALVKEGLSNHCSSGTDPLDIVEFASTIPVATVPATPTTAEIISMKEWMKKDAQTKGIIYRKLPPIIQNMLGEKLTARQQWEVLLKRFARLDGIYQFKLRSRLFAESERRRGRSSLPRRL